MMGIEITAVVVASVIGLVIATMGIPGMRRTDRYMRQARRDAEDLRRADAELQTRALEQVREDVRPYLERATQGDA
jgi:hypothetical protein